MGRLEYEAGYASLSVEEHARFHEIVEPYEELWEVGKTPRLEEFLDGVTGRLRPVLLRELLLIEARELRARNGFPPYEEELIDRHRDLAAEIPAAIDALPPEEAPYPKRVGDFEILDLIDYGSQARVFKARAVRLNLNKDVALKLIAPSATHSRDSRAVLVKEGQALAAIRHDNVVDVYALDTSGDRTFMVMELLDGGSLATKYKGTNRVRAVKAAAIISKVARGLHAAHSNRQYHWDVKPSNILFDTRDEPHITDFGMAFARPHWPGDASERPLVGTVAFMAPEQAACADGIDPVKCDVFGLGATLYWLIVRRPPYDAPTFEERLALAQACAFDKAALRRQPGVPGSLKRICLRAMAADPADRFATAGEFADALERFVRSRELLRLLLVAAPAVAAVGLASGAAVFWLFRQPEPSGAPAASAAPDRPAISPAMSRILEHQNLALAVATADLDTLGQVRLLGLSTDQVVAALRDKPAGEKECAAARFFAATGESPEALAWLSEMLAHGLDPETVVPGGLYDGESLLRSAMRNRNWEAVLLLLDRGASPHGYQDLLGHYDDAPPFLFPYLELQQLQVSDDVRRRLAEAYRHAGAIVPDMGPPGTDGRRFTELEELAAAGEGLFGFPLERSQPLIDDSRSPIAARATRRSGFDWNQFLIEVPKIFVAKDDTPALGGGQIQVFTISHLLSIVGGDAYFLGVTRYFRPTLCLARADKSGRELSFYVYGGPSMWGLGQPRLRPGESPVDAYDRWHWQRFDFVIDEEALTARGRGRGTEAVYRVVRSADFTPDESGQWKAKQEPPTP